MIALTLVIALFGSCATSQHTNADNSLLLMMIGRTSVSRNDLFVYYQVQGDDFKLKVDPLTEFQQYNMMEPGIYYSKKIQSVYIKSGKLGHSNDFGSAFTLQPNTVTIFPYKFNMILNMEGGRVKSQSYKLIKLTAEDYAACDAYIASQKRYEGLAVRK